VQCVGRTGGRIQQQAGSALLDVATSGSGAPGCARASADEIDSLLAALQNPSAVVRDAALRVSVIQIRFLAVGCHVNHNIHVPSSLCSDDIRYTKNHCFYLSRKEGDRVMKGRRS
jgi:hypothetical protein